MNSSISDNNDSDDSSFSSSPASAVVDSSGLGESVHEKDSNSSTGFTSMSNEFNAALDEFRNNWQREIKSSIVIENSSNPTDNCHTMAESLFRKGIELEQCGKMYDAIKFYKKAEQLIPDIEFKFYETNKSNSTVNLKQANYSTKRIDLSSETLLNTRELVSKFHLDLAECGKLISDNREAGFISTGAHISELPMEILIYIMRWVVSAELDLRSLEQCSKVCKGFYICARDEEIWRQSCFRVWGCEDDLTLTTEKYDSWRQMFIERPRINFHGCYISKTTYLRMGENSFQDQYYRPVHLIEYYRYVRFMPDRTVYMMTSSDEPALGVVKMNNLSQPRSEIMKGTYRLLDDKITISLKKHQKIINNSTYHNTYSRQNVDITKYYIEFSITGTSKRRHRQLQWRHYSIQQFHNKVETLSTFELSPSKYPPLWFSPVRSYHSEAGAPLNW